MGEVYRAVDRRLPREIAIKTSQQRFSERFAREAKVIASLNHPNICTLFDVGPNYLVMEMIEALVQARTWRVMMERCNGSSPSKICSEDGTSTDRSSFYA